MFLLRFLFTLYYRYVASHACSGLARESNLSGIFSGKESSMTSERRLVKCLSLFPFFSRTINIYPQIQSISIPTTITTTAITITTRATTATVPACKLCFYTVQRYVSSYCKALSHRVLAEYVMVSCYQDTERAKHEHRFPESYI